MKETFSEILKVYLGKLDIGKTIVLATACLSFLGSNWALVYIEIPTANKDIFTHFTGIIDGAFIGIVSWYFGSSKSSQKKSDMIDKLTDKQ